jgi:hypothetical protein
MQLLSNSCGEPYFYIDNAEFGALFLKVCSYAPWSIKLCLNGHEWAKPQFLGLVLCGEYEIPAFEGGGLHPGPSERP